MPLELGSHTDGTGVVELPEAALLRHVVILGATGSGKTVFAKAFLEEAVRAGVPVIAVDPQGDLVSLALRPRLGDEDGHPAPADVVEGYWSRAAVTIFTPGSTKGTAIGLNPLRQPPGTASAEDWIVSLDALAETLAAAMGYDPAADVGVRVKDVLFLTLQRAFKAGEWPRDLRDLVARLGAELPDEAARLLTDRERAALVRRAESLTVGAKGLLFTAGPPMDVEAMLEPPRKGRVPVNVVYTGGLRSTRERDLVVATLCKDVFAWMTARPSGDLRLVFYIDEVAGLCPPHPRNPPTKKFLSLLFRQARKFGVGMIVATQNVTDLDYKALGQANTWALGRLMAKQDLDRVRHVIASLNGGSHEEILPAIPSLRAGEFLLLSPDHLPGVTRLAVRGLATRHEVVPEQKFREVQEAALRAESTFKPDDRSVLRRRAATAVTREAKATVATDVEEGIGLRVLNLFDDAPGFYESDEIQSRILGDERFLPILLRKMVEHRLLLSEQLDGREVFWDPAIGFDPRRGGPAQLAVFPLRYPLVQATKRAREHFRRRMLVIPQERLTRKAFYYLPMWRVEAGIPVGKKQETATRHLYVNAVSGEIAYPASGGLTFEEIPRKDARPLDSLAWNGTLDRVPAAKVGQAIPLAKVGPAQAREIVRTLLGATPLSDPEIVLLPIWRFDLASKADSHGRSLWIDGAFGSVFHEAP